MQRSLCSHFGRQALLDRVAQDVRHDLTGSHCAGICFCFSWYLQKDSLQLIAQCAHKIHPGLLVVGLCVMLPSAGGSQYTSILIATCRSFPLDLLQVVVFLAQRFILWPIAQWAHKIHPGLLVVGPWVVLRAAGRPSHLAHAMVQFIYKYFLTSFHAGL